MILANGFASLTRVANCILRGNLLFFLFSRPVFYRKAAGGRRAFLAHQTKIWYNRQQQLVKQGKEKPSYDERTLQ